MSKKSKWILPVALAGALVGGYQLFKADVGQEALRYFQNKPTVVQTVSDEYVPTKGVEVENDFQYSANDIWYNRMGSLEGLAKNTNAGSITSETISDLRAVARDDQDWRIRKLASSMIKSYDINGDFSDTESYRKLEAEKQRLTILTSTDFGYNANDIWYNRQDALENLVRNPSEISGGLVKDLRLVAQKDDDWRIRKLASSMIKSYDINGDFRAVEIYQPKK
ncbi:MAG: hypothetical protein AABX29_02530 [Nanoarchaeota archaeon]|mgnify:FL=1